MSEVFVTLRKEESLILDALLKMGVRMSMKQQFQFLQGLSMTDFLQAEQLKSMKNG